MKIIVKKVKAWQNDPSAPVVLGFFGSITNEVRDIFKEVSQLTEQKDTKEHVGKFYLNNNEKFYYVRDKYAAELAINKINEKFGENTAKLVWQSGVV